MLKSRYDGTAPKLVIVAVKVKRCQNGYAWVVAIPDRTACKAGKGYCYDDEQLLLRWSGGSWRTVTAGTGLTCVDEQLAEVRQACQALGYPG